MNEGGTQHTGTGSGIRDRGPVPATWDQQLCSRWPWPCKWAPRAGAASMCAVRQVACEKAAVG